MSKPYDAGYTFGQGIHEMGTPEWGRDPKKPRLIGNKPSMGCEECSLSLTELV